MYPPRDAATRPGDTLCNHSETGYGGLGQADEFMFVTRLLAVAIALAATLAAAPGEAQLPSRVPVVTCTNPASGATWQISIDYDQATVDSNPARVSDAEISWHDGKGGGNYTLDRKSGDLTVVTPSSTGGYFIHDHCGPPP